MGWIGGMGRMVAVLLLAQAQFEVASVKPNLSGDPPYLMSYRGDRFTHHYVTLKAMICSAFGTPEHALLDKQVVGGPSWIFTDHFDVEAKAPAVPESPRGIIPGRVMAMLRSLLEERFHLSTHFEKRELPVYNLILARADGTLGPRLRRRVTPCSPCPRQILPGTMSAKGATMGNIVSGFERFVPDVGRVVLNQTGLTGEFDIDLNWAPDQSAPSTGGVSFFTAVREQLGLKLEPAKAPVDVLVIDRVERPAEN